MPTEPDTNLIITRTQFERVESMLNEIASQAQDCRLESANALSAGKETIERVECIAAALIAAKAIEGEVHAIVAFLHRVIVRP